MLKKYLCSNTEHTEQPLSYIPPQPTTEAEHDQMSAKLLYILGSPLERKNGPQRNVSNDA